MRSALAAAFALAALSTSLLALAPQDTFAQSEPMRVRDVLKEGILPHAVEIFQLKQYITKNVAEPPALVSDRVIRGEQVLTLDLLLIGDAWKSDEVSSYAQILQEYRTLSIGRQIASAACRKEQPMQNNGGDLSVGYLDRKCCSRVY